MLDTVIECENEGKRSATIVMHSGIMRSVIVALFGLEKRDFLDMSVANGMGYVVTFKDAIPVFYRRLERRSL